MFIEMSNRAWHRTFADGVAWLNAQLKCYYATNPTLSRIHLTVAMLRPRDCAYPTLRSKAAECRHLAGFALFLASRHRDRSLVFRNQRLAPFSAEYRDLAVDMAQNLYVYHEVCSAEPFVETACRGAMVKFIEAMNGLRSLFRRNLAPELHDSQPFIFRVKGHMLDHLARDKLMLWGSPKHSWCYSDEDFVGLVKRIAVTTKHPLTVEKRLLEKYRLYAALHAYALERAGE